MRKLLKLFILFIFIHNNLYAQEYERYKTLLDSTFRSSHLGFDKDIRVTVPFDWQANAVQSFPLIIIFDSQNQRSHQYIINTIDYLTSNEQMPASVVISVSSDEANRYKETLHLASNEKGAALANEQFIFDELIPMAEKHFHAENFRMLIGHSRYGYFTTAMFSSRIHDLNAVISLSPFFTQKNVDLTDSIATLSEVQLKAHKYYRFGIGNDYPADYASMQQTLQSLNHPMVHAKGVFFKSADHNVTPGLTIAPALYEIFETWSLIQADYFSNEQKDLSIMNELAEKITQHYGAPLAFSLGILNGKGWYFFGEEEYEKAIQAWEIMLKSYPNFTEAYLYIMEAQNALKQNTESSKAKFLAGLKTTAIYSSEEKAELMKELDNLQSKLPKQEN
ncbi:hypothetical protein DNU06_08020 [Putridiphycobacter roseus]|uniref:Esterase n=1 Tax=Putridiphycobacter roseus TaxID=2219161 RepID=A0A2W1N0Z6_9FLAO|nr:alpha/beta hydrolase-fold protein [Putridiphycobacter roseus]PZE17210.1 hypothetical protein DNU06_08020 [Putridiphycobacter roseus]